MTRKRWTREEDDRIIEKVNDESVNLSKAFRELSTEIDRTVEAITYRWYAVLNNPEHSKYRGTTCFVTICRKQNMHNRKILRENSPIGVAKPTKKSLWNTIKKFFKKEK